MSGENPRFLLEEFPGIRANISHAMLGTFPTPVQRLDRLEKRFGDGAPCLYVKRDDLSGTVYGGNKVRKLEFLLARAVRDGYKDVLTFGGAGSNHTLATTLYARELGLGSVSMLVPQPSAICVRRNLLLSYSAGADLQPGSSMPAIAARTILLLLRRRFQGLRAPYLIPPGGSSAIGMIGFVNAGFELRHQIETGELPEPDCIYATSGSMGTVVGLLLGLKAAGLQNTKIVAVHVAAPIFSSLYAVRRMFKKTNDCLRNADPAFPNIAFPESDFRFNRDYYGGEYGRYTPEAMQAIRLFEETAGIPLEGTYTGKTLAAMLADVEAGKLRGKTALFWNTCNSRYLKDELPDVDCRLLPKPLHRYFEEEVQPLDR